MRRLLMLIPVAVGTVLLVGAALVPAAAGEQVGWAPLTIDKEVDGIVPPNSEFTVEVECDNGKGGPIIFNPNGPPVASVKIDFDAEGDPDGANTIRFSYAGTCTITETEDGDAEGVSYECEGHIPNLVEGTEFTVQNGITEPCESNGPQDQPIRVFIAGEDQSATVTVTNEFPDPPPASSPAAQPLAVAPNFTG